MSIFRVNRMTAAFIVLIVLGVGAYAAARALRKSSPTALGPAADTPLSAVQEGDYWYWIERPRSGRARLFRMSRSGSEEIATADEIAGFDVKNGKMAWAARDGKQWTIMSGPAAGQKSAVWTGTDTVGRPCIDGERVLWASSHAGLLRNGLCIPALGPILSVMTSNGQGPPKVVATLFESNGSLLGVHDNLAYVAARRRGTAATAIYEVALADGKWQRVVGQEGMSEPLLNRDGTLFWVAPSQDSTNTGTVSSVRSLVPGKKVTTIADWLPANGDLYVIGTDAYYVDGIARSSVWPVGSNDRLAHNLALPEGYQPVAVGERDILLQRTGGPSKSQHLFVVPRT